MGGDDRVDAAGGRCGGVGGGPEKAPAEEWGGTPEGRGEGLSPRAVGGRGRPSVFFDPATYAKKGGGDRRGSAGGEPPNCVKARRAAAASAIAPTVAALSSLFRDVLRLLRSGLMRTFLLEGECGDVAGGVRPDSGTGVLLSAEETREVLGRLGEGGGGLSEERRRGTDERCRGGWNPPATREAEPGTPGGAHRTQAVEKAMVTLAATELEGGGTPSDTPEQLHGSPTLPSGVGGGTLSDTAGQQHGGPPASDIAMVGGTREEGGLAPWRRREPQSGGQHRRRRWQRLRGQGLRGSCGPPLGSLALPP